MLAKLIKLLKNQKSLFGNYSNEFQENTDPNKLGSVNSIKTRINIEPNAQLELMRARAGPFAMKEVMEADID